MANITIYKMATDADLSHRVKASVATQGGAVSLVSPDSALMWTMAAQPGWAAAWESALASNNQNPGLDAAVITDAQILSALQAALPATITPAGIASLNFTYVPFNNSTITTALPINWNNGGDQIATTTASAAPVITFPTPPPAPCELTLALKGPASGSSGLLTWPAFKGTAPTTTAIAAGTTRMVWIWYDGANYWQTATQTA